jgi:hypothetical protein
MAGKKKPMGRDPIIAICLNLVRTHEARKKSIKYLKIERDRLLTQLPGFSLTDMPKAPPCSVDDPVYRIMCEIEEIDNQIEAETRRIQAVDCAIRNIVQGESDPAMRKQIHKFIMDNIEEGGFFMPYERMADEFPEEFTNKYPRHKFYKDRLKFLIDVGEILYLIPKL